MGLAMRSAEIAVERLRAGPCGGGDEGPGLRGAYRRLWRPRSLACRGAGRLASSRRCANMVAPLLRAAPGALRPVLSLLEK
jgi:hypothetical protein